MSIPKLSLIYCAFFLVALSNSGCSHTPPSSKKTSVAVIDKSSLTQTICQSQKVTYKQAQDGTRALLTIAACKLSPINFAMIIDAIPDSNMIFSHYTSAIIISDKSKLKDGCAYLIRSFRKEGLSCKIIPTFASLITAYLEEIGHKEAAQLFSTAVTDTFSERVHLMMHSFAL